MINKFYKRIHNKYLKVFKFFFFLRHVFTIFLIATSLFFLIPKFFNYEKKQEIIQEYLNNYYNLELNNYQSIEFKIFPLPNLLIKNADYNIKGENINLKSFNINIFLNLKNIYNYQNFNANKILLYKNELFLDINKTENFISYINKLNHKLNIRDLNINLKKLDETLIMIKGVNFSNHGYQKYKIYGEVFGKKFKASLKNNNKNLKFKISNSGIEANFDFKEKKLNNNFSGSSKIKFKNNLLKFDFNIDDNEFEMNNSSFRNKNLSLSLDSLIKFNPFFSTTSNIKVNEIDKNLLEKINLKKLLKNKEVIKKLNSNIYIYYKSKKYFSNLIEEQSLDLNLAYGRLIFNNKILIQGGQINCQGDSTLVDEYPRLNFICSINIDNKKKFFKKFSISENLNKRAMNLKIEGSLNLLNRKVNFKKINIDDEYLANEEDLNYFNEKFSDVLFNKKFFQIFNQRKINQFLIEII